jgi:hypothetical protein
MVVRRLRLRMQLGLALMSCGMGWLVWQGATLDPPSAEHPQAFYLTWPLIIRACLWLGAGVVGLVCVAVGTRKAVDVGYLVLTVMPTQRAAGWAWESAASAVHCASELIDQVGGIAQSGRWGDLPSTVWHASTSGHCYAAMSTAIISAFWFALVAVVLAAAAVPDNVGRRRH